MYSIDEVKKFDEKDIEQVLSSIDKCCRGLRVIEDLIKGYVDEDDFKSKQENISFLVDDIEAEKGYDIFLLFFGVIYRINDDEKGIIEDREKAPLLFLIENLPGNIEPQLPWGNLITNRFLYTEEIENDYLKLTPEVCDIKVENSKDFFKNIKLDPIHEAVLKKMQDQKFSIRAPEVFALYASLLIAEDLKIDIKEENLESEFKENYSFKLKSHVKELFNKYYKLIKKDISKKENLPTLDLQDPLWISLLLQLKKMGNQMFLMKRKYGIRLTKLRSKNILDELFHEIQDFLNKHFNGTDNIPARKNLEDKPYGPKLIKKIALGDGNKIKGLDLIRIEYKRFLLRQTISFSDKNNDSDITTPLSNRLRKIIDLENQIFQEIKNKADSANAPYEPVDRYIVKKTSPGYYSMLDVIIEDKKENQIFGIYIIKLKSINIGFQSIGSRLNRMKLQLSKSISKIYIVADYNPLMGDDIKLVEKGENKLKSRGFDNIKIISITQLAEIFKDNEEFPDPEEFFSNLK